MFLERVNEQEAVVTAAGEIDSTMAQAIEELKLMLRSRLIAYVLIQQKQLKTFTTSLRQKEGICVNWIIWVNSTNLISWYQQSLP